MTQSLLMYVLVVVVGVGLLVLGCGAAQKNPAVVECDAAATAEIVPQVKAAVDAKNYVVLAELLVRYGAELYACAHRELAKQANDAGVPAKDGAP